MPETRIALRNADLRLFDPFYSLSEANDLYEELLQQIVWHQPEIMLFGKTVQSPRLAAWYGDEGAVYVYSGLINRPMPWLPGLAKVKNKLQQLLQCRFNSVLVNRYRDGNDAMGWHADDERELGPQPVIASLSLGASRRFLLRPKKNKAASSTKQPSTAIDLHHGSVLVMAGETQDNWQHSISRTKKQIGQRINMTFRFVNNSSHSARGIQRT